MKLLNSKKILVNFKQQDVEVISYYTQNGQNCTVLAILSVIELRQGRQILKIELSAVDQWENA